MKRKICNNLVLLFILGVSLSGIFAARTVLAQNEEQAINITVSPVFLDITTNPGQKAQDKIRLRNNLDTEQELFVSVAKLKVQGEDGSVVPVEPEEGDDFLSWISFEKKRFTAPPKEWFDLKLTVNVPEDAGFGYYYAVKVGPREPDPSIEETTKLQGEVIVPILLNVKKEGAKAEGNVVEFKSQAFINEHLPIDFTARISNTGNVHIKPRGNIFVKNFRNKDIAVLDINKNNGNILPDSIRSFSTSWDDGFLVKEPVVEDGKIKKDSNGKTITSLKIHWNKLLSFRVGHYSAQLIMVYDNGDRDIPIEASTDFWVIPYTFIIIIIAILLIIFFISKYLLRIYVKKQIRKYGGKV